MTCFLSSFTVEVSSPQELLHTDFRPPLVFTHSLSLFLNLLSTATVPSCHPSVPSRLYLPSTLLYMRIITKPFYQMFRIHLGPSHIFLGLGLRPLSFFRSVRLFFPSCFAAALIFFAPPENHASSDVNHC